MPFPSIESNEIYALATFDKPLDGNVQDDTVQGGSVQGGSATGTSAHGGTCQLGQWVQVSIDRPWASRLETIIGHRLPGLPSAAGQS